MKGGFAPGRHRFKSEGKGLIARLAVAIYVCSGCGLWVGAAKPAQCKACGRLDFMRFDSKAEAQRWAQLELLQAAGQISELKRQVRFPLHAAIMDQQTPAIVAAKVADYVADFTYRENGRLVVEDAKGSAITDVAALKLRWFHAQYGFQVKLTNAA